MNSAAVDIKDMVVADSSLGYEFGTNIFVDTMPHDQENEAVSIWNSPAGRAPVGQPRDQYYRPAVTIQSRAYDPTIAHSNAFDLFQLLHGVHGEIWNGCRYISILAVQEPRFVYRDESDRAVFSFDLRIDRTPV